MKRNWGKWIPLIAIPVLLIICYFLWTFISPADAAPQHISRLIPGFPIVATMGSYLSLFFIHMALFFVLRSYKANLLFSLACLVWLLSTGMQMFDMFPSGDLHTRLMLFLRPEYLAIPITGILLINVACKIFPNIFKKWFMHTFVALMAAFALVFLIFDETIISRAIIICYGVLGAAALCMIFMLALKLRKLSLERITFLVGFAVLLFGALCLALGNTDDSICALVAFFTYNHMLLFFLLTSASLLFGTYRETLDANAENQRLAAQELIAESQLDFQREQFSRLMENVEATKIMRHDMKHHLAVISEYVQADNMSGIKGYLEGMEYGLNASRGKHFCDNYAVNAIVSHYLGAAERNDVQVKVKLTVPTETGCVKESDLCVIVGNLLENAVDACKGVKDGNKFIRFFSYVSDNTITFTVENSFGGDLDEEDGVFHSTKHDGEGIGLYSVASVTEKYDGAARFEARDNVFYSHAYVDMGAF